jgi:hypothetical protein
VTQAPSELTFEIEWKGKYSKTSEKSPNNCSLAQSQGMFSHRQISLLSQFCLSCLSNYFVFSDHLVPNLGTWGCVHPDSDARSQFVPHSFP